MPMAHKPWKHGPAKLGADLPCASWQGQERSGTLTLAGDCPRCNTNLAAHVFGSAVIVTAAADGAAAFDAVTFSSSAPATRRTPADRRREPRAVAPTGSPNRARTRRTTATTWEISTQPEPNAAAQLIAEDVQATGAGDADAR